LENVIIYHNVVHSLNKFKKEGMVIKLDLSKSYDLLSLKYLIWALKDSVSQILRYVGYTSWSLPPSSSS